MPGDMPPDDFRHTGGSRFRQRLELVGLARPHAEPPAPPSLRMTEVVYFQFRYPGGAPDLADVAARFGFEEDELDQAFGVASAGRERDIYLVLAHASARPRVESGLDPAGDPATRFVIEPGTSP